MVRTSEVRSAIGGFMGRLNRACFGIGLALAILASWANAEDAQQVPPWQRSPASAKPSSPRRAAKTVRKPAPEQLDAALLPDRAGICRTGYTESVPANPSTQVCEVAGPALEKPPLPEPLLTASSDPGTTGPGQQPAPPNRIDAQDPLISESCDVCGPCCGTRSTDRCRLWVSAEALVWWTKGMDAPPLVTRGAGADPFLAGVLGQQGTSILYGGSNSGGDEARLGMRYSVGWWLNAEQTWAVQGDFLSLGEACAPYSAASDGSLILARPYRNTLTGVQASSLVAFPAQQSGQLDIQATSELQGFGLVLRKELFAAPQGECDFLIGYRYLRLGDRLEIDETTTALSGTAAGTTQTLVDRFSTNNEFHGLDLGLSWTRAMANRWSLDVLAKVAVGDTRSAVVIDGTTTSIAPPQAPVVTSGGPLTRPETILDRENSFSVIPELSAAVGFDLTPRLRATVGYSLLYWSKVARAGQQISTDLQPTATSTTLPVYRYTSDDYWAHGLSAGLDWHF